MGRSFFIVDCSPRKRETICGVAPSSVTMELIEAKIDPADDKPTAEHGAVGTFDESYGPHDEGQAKDGERDVAVGDLSER
jgi:hypothetical protein